MTLTESVKPKIGNVSLIRGSRMTGEPCMFCGVAPKDSFIPLLQIAGPHSKISLCAFHEGEMLMVLLKNYLRRQRRGKRVGYVGPLFKPEALPVTIDDFDQE